MKPNLDQSGAAARSNRVMRTGGLLFSPLGASRVVDKWHSTRKSTNNYVAETVGRPTFTRKFGGFTP
jgi:uncharacterized protein (DUF736 family)